MPMPSPFAHGCSALVLLASCATHADLTPTGPPALLAFAR